MPDMGRILCFIILAMTFSLSGCDQDPSWSDRVIRLSEDSLAPYREALQQFDRSREGFPPLPTSGTLKIEIVDREHWKREYAPPRYDVMLHFIGKHARDYQYSYCTVAFKKASGHLLWIGEQHLYNGPRQYEEDGQMSQESLTITKEDEQVAVKGEKLIGTDVRYNGPDSRSQENLKISDIAPILKQWGYFPGAYNAGKVRPAKEIQTPGPENKR